MAGRPENPDRDLQHKKNIFHRQRAQAKYRGETWNLDYDQWWGMWEPYWDLRGRKLSEYCMRQLDTQLGWEPNNLEVCERITFFKEQHTRGEQKL